MRLTVAIVLLLNVMMTAAQPNDQTVFKAFPANITCGRNKAQRKVERQNANKPNMLVFFIKSIAIKWKI